MSRIRGLIFAKQFPSSVEPMRGTFVARQMAATSDGVDWRVIAPVPWAPRFLGDVLRRPQPPARERLSGVTVDHPRYLVAPRRLGYRSAADAMRLASRRALADAIGAGLDIVHAHGIYPSACAALAGLPAGLPAVVTIHGSDLRSNRDDEALRARMRDAAARADRVVCVSGALASDAASALAIDEREIVVLPNAYDDALFTRIERDAPGERPHLVCVGRLEVVKGHAVLIEAFARLVRAGCDASLTIVGDGSQRASLERAAASAGVADRITFAGAVSGEGLRAELGRAHLFVQPSLREGFGVSVVEALATGLPVVATRSGGPEDIVTEQDGVLAAPGDAAALADAITCALDRIGGFDGADIARRASARYAPAAIGAALMGLYASLLERGDRRA